MKSDNKLSLAKNWEKKLEQMMLKRPIGLRCECVYICSPCRADTTNGVIRNMMAARVYMYYAYQNFTGVPKAPHAFLPVLLNDCYEDERDLALRFGKQILESCDKLFVCGNRLSEGMYGEITYAAKRGIPIHVFHNGVHADLCQKLRNDGLDEGILLNDDDHSHFVLSWGADELALCWEVDAT